MEYLVPVWAHQKEAIERTRGLKEFALLWDCGTGKTSATINILREKYNAEKRVLRTLILGPLITVENWRAEWLRHSRIDPKLVVCLQGSGRKRVDAFRENANGDDGTERRGVVCITNFEALLMPELQESLMQWAPECLVVDESHRCKDVKSKRTKAVIRLADQATYRYILSGTPILNSPLDIFAQFRILDRGATFGKNFFSFRAMYFYDKNAGMPRHNYFPNWQIRPGALDEINQKLYTKAMRVTKEECLDLPPLVKEVRHVELSPEQRKAYNELKKDFVTYVKSGACVANLAITKALRMQQIVSGHIPVVDVEGEKPATEIVEFKGTPRQAALKEILEELTHEHKVIVWAVFRENYAQIRAVCDDLGIAYTECHGDVPGTKKFANVDAFNQDPNIRVLIGHPGSGGIGINLVSASYAIFYSRSFSLEHDLQAESRNHRGGSEIHAKVTRIDLIAKDTIDEMIQARLSQKFEVSERVLKDIVEDLSK